jgi:hypothetical protein
MNTPCEFLRGSGPCEWLPGFPAMARSNSSGQCRPAWYGPARRRNNAAAQRLALFHQVLESHIVSERPNYATVFSDCGFGVFYTPKVCADSAVALMRDFLRVKVPGKDAAWVWNLPRHWHHERDHR